MSLSRLGARRAVGVDLSPGSLSRAREIAGRAGAGIEFVEANVCDAREAVTGDFDLVYTSIGVLSRYRLREDPDRLALQYVLTAHRPDSPSHG